MCRCLTDIGLSCADGGYQMADPDRGIVHAVCATVSDMLPGRFGDRSEVEYWPVYLRSQWQGLRRDVTHEREFPNPVVAGSSRIESSPPPERVRVDSRPRP